MLKQRRKAGESEGENKPFLFVIQSKPIAAIPSISKTFDLDIGLPKNSAQSRSPVNTVGTIAVAKMRKSLCV